MIWEVQIEIEQYLLDLFEGIGGKGQRDLVCVERL